MVLVMKTITERTKRLVIAEMLLKESMKDVEFYSKRVIAEPTEANRNALADAEAMADFYEQEVYIWS
jgi:hypothetical protein